MPEEVALTCTYCGEQYTRHPSSAMQSRFCSTSCQHKHRHAHPAEHFGEKKTEYYDTREQVFERDGQQCIHCEKGRGENVLDLELHHVIPSKYFLDYSESYFEENLVTLCSVCHTAWDRTIRNLAEEEGSEHAEFETAVKEWCSENRPFLKAPADALESSDVVERLRDELDQERED
ncbi:HNH endonuclease [Natrialba aegyptia]|uniref:HNH endonuclease n=1 Tax=Natrialba aegyptia TaxID=129789 RepID=UPI00403AC8D0